MMSLLRHKDARGRESTTLAFVRITWAVLLIKYLLGGLTISHYGPIPVVGTGEFGTAVTLILGIWLGREWTEKKEAPKP